MACQAIAQTNPRRGEKIPFDPAQKARFANRSSVERVNSDLKDNHGGNHIRVKGHSKFMSLRLRLEKPSRKFEMPLCHLMLGLLVIAASNMFTMLC